MGKVKFMKTKSFEKYLEKRLNKEEIAEIEEQAELEIRLPQSIQGEISAVMNDDKEAGYF
jgi:hypothetical protein